MKRQIRKVLVSGAAVSLLLGLQMGSAAAASRKVCAEVTAHGYGRCHAVVQADSGGLAPLRSSSPQGLGPAALRAAYGVQQRANPTIGIVTAYDAPHVLSDLNTYSQAFGLPKQPTCTTPRQSACFEKLNQSGTSTYPAASSSWAVETSLDTQAAHGLCPSCRLELVEATTPTLYNLATAVDQAAAHGAQVISNSYGGPETASESRYDRLYTHPGITLLASSGDSGYGTSYPAASPQVLAIGGTSLVMNGLRRVSETAWSGSGSGCSQIEAKPSWQHDGKCAGRSLADLAADADPATGAAIYDSYGATGRAPWLTVGGTSLASPLVAGIIAASGQAGTPAAWYYANAATALRDIGAGATGRCQSYLCKAGPGYDGPTGLGALNHL